MGLLRLLAAALLAASPIAASPGNGPAASPETPPPPVFEYSLAEREKSLGPAGERIRAVGGRVLVQGGRARWTLASSRFPRSRASEAILDGRGGLLLLDPEAREVASGAAADFLSLFRPPAPDEPSAASFRDVAVDVGRSGEGRPFQDEPTSRWAFRGKWVLSTVVPGRVSSARTTAEGVVETLAPEGPFAAARSGLDDLVRLFPARGEALEAIARELAKVRGLPVRFRATFTTEQLGEPFGAPGEASSPPLRVRVETTREVTGLVRREGLAADALFAPPEEYRSRPMERLVPPPEGPR